MLWGFWVLCLVFVIWGFGFGVWAGIRQNFVVFGWLGFSLLGVGLPEFGGFGFRA